MYKIGEQLISYFYSKCFVDLVLNWQSVAVPTEPPLHMETTLVGVASHYILDKIHMYMQFCISSTLP